MCLTFYNDYIIDDVSISCMQRAYLHSSADITITLLFGYCIKDGNVSNSQHAHRLSFPLLTLCLPLPLTAWFRQTKAQISLHGFTQRLTPVSYLLCNIDTVGMGECMYRYFFLV